MPGPARTDLLRRAIATLERNRRGDHTCPAPRLYPHQWLWDSCFIAIGIAHYDAPRAAEELRALFRGQWANGMLPHMIFVPGVPDLGSRRIWQSRRHPGAPREVDTSCITQPPVAAIAVERVVHTLPRDDRPAFLAEMVPKLVAYHRWLFDARVRPGSGLVTLIHPWECGLDSTPPWMRALRDWHMPWWLRTAERLNLARLLRRLRYDTRYLPATDRASDDDGLRMIALAVHLKQHDFHLARLTQHHAVLIEDIAFNAIFCAANDALARLGVIELADESARHRAAIEQLWHEPTQQYCSRDAVTGEPLTERTIAGFLPLWGGTDRASQLVEQLRTPATWPRHPVPSVPTDAPEFLETRYWMGPTWVNTNWMIVEGLVRHGEHELADELRRRTLDLVEDAGFAEYFSPLDGQGHGADEFSWTAALAVDLAQRSGSGSARSEGFERPTF